MKNPGVLNGLVVATLFLTASLPAAQPAPTFPVPLTREEQLQHFDKNRDGKLDGPERAAIMDFLRLRLDGMRSLFRKTAPKFDLNADSRLDATELAAFAAAVRPELSRYRDQLALADLNHDGRVDDAEWRQVCAEVQRAYAALFFPVPVKPVS